MNINVFMDKRGSKKGWWAADKGRDEGVGGIRGVSYYVVYPAGGPRDPDRALMSPTVP